MKKAIEVLKEALQLELENGEYEEIQEAISLLENHIEAREAFNPLAWGKTKPRDPD